MKFRNYSLTFFTMLLLGSAAFLGACATTGMDRSVNTSNSVQEVTGDIRELIAQIDLTGASLDSLVRGGQPDLKKAFDIYSDDLAKLDIQGERMLKHFREMKLRSTEYFAEWEKRGNVYTNPQIRNLSDERRNKLTEIYAQVPKSFRGVERAYFAYLIDLKEIKAYLSYDLTTQGVESISPVTEKSVQDRNDLKASLEPVLSALVAIKAELYEGPK